MDVQEGNLGHWRIACLDDTELDIFEQQAIGRYTVFSQKARLSPYILGLDPYSATTTVFVLGNTKSVYVTAYNPTGYAVPANRIRVWGFRYVLDRLTTRQERILQHMTLNMYDELPPEDKQYARDTRLTATVIPAEGREA